ncbi:hypothetical protein [Bacillus sp. ISL-46]|uniref:hypothetical protein n=1 Tax=Bacillus sp. ISL-46 TaxID=2819129 RepID=UPI001BE94078|nr:hypothetical protein [Bacillus sp. ISL-46]MBT2721446.1 hypothetical protein [Bacillus sp. ISL-46]
MTQYTLDDKTRKALQSVGETMQKFQLQLANSPELNRAIQQQKELSQSIGKMQSDMLIQLEPTFKQLAQIGAAYEEQMKGISKIIQNSGITETLQRVSAQMKTLDFTRINLNPLIDLPETEPVEFVGDELPPETTAEIEAALNESGLATLDEPNEENVNRFIEMIQTTLTHPLAKEVGMGIVLGIILPVIYLALMHMGLDLQKVSDLGLPSLTIIKMQSKKKEDE